MADIFTTRFAPSPTGLLHRGHAYAALIAFRRAAREGGRFLLRIEDIDQTRCRPEFVDQLLNDLSWLGLKWEEPVLFQSTRFDAYASALDTLQQKGILYPCFCTRADIRREVEAAPSAPHGPDGPVYPGTCRALAPDEVSKNTEAGLPYAWRLDIAKASALVGKTLSWRDERAGDIKAKPEVFGDVVIARKDTPTSYHLAVVVDDAFQGVSHVVRGVDLFEATHIHRLLQALLNLPTPIYHHHDLLLDETGERLAKRRGSESLKSLRDQGVSKEQVLLSLPFASD